MSLRLPWVILPSVCALALAAYGYPGSGLGYPVLAHGHNTRGTRIVDSHTTAAGCVVISAAVAGQVMSIEVHNNERVSRGEVLFRIDRRPYLLGVAVARADLAMAQHHISELKVVYQRHLAALADARDVFAYEQRVHDRQNRLLSRNVISQSEFDQTLAAFLDARERVLAEQEVIAEVLAGLDNSPDLPIDQHAVVAKAKAKLDRAELYLSDAAVTAPEDGTVTNVGRLRVGEYVQVGTEAFDLVSNEPSSRS